MRITDILAKKRDGLPLSGEEISRSIRGIADGTVGDEQAAALLMAIRIRGMDARETADLSLAMAHSGQIADLGALPGIKVDKHSTGGVGDTTTLVAVPLAAACGATVVKMSGRSLGHSGGTLDKLWAIPGMRTDFSVAEIIQIAARTGCAVVGQTAELAPADKRLYAIRDVTATVDSLPLIASSILSKKIAAGADAIVLDIKFGSGALIEPYEQARALAQAMVDIGEHAGRKIVAVLTDMSQPLGSHVGNALEVKEAIDLLAGRAAGPLLEVSLRLAALMVQLGGIEGDAGALVEAALQSGAGLAKLGDMIGAQGGDARVITDPGRLPSAPLVVAAGAPRQGFVQSIRCAQVGLVAQSLGAGRQRKEDAIDPAVGLVMAVRVGDEVAKGQPIAHIHARDEASARAAADALIDAVSIGEARPAPVQLIRETLSGSL